MRRRPVHEPYELRPVIDFLERQDLHRRSRYHEAVEALVQDVVQRLVECVQMLRRRVFGVMAGYADEAYVRLERGIAQEAEELGLRDHLGGHKV